MFVCKSLFYCIYIYPFCIFCKQVRQFYRVSLLICRSYTYVIRLLNSITIALYSQI
uniref:Glutaredoxin n=1 Tax=Podoviridae sp. ctZkC8 TaxID=2825259 RepID=A0A8S5UBI4_9CAUD|nr:MAG TPA: Glutaredoxin [Podoviridae sp. ctZkC8]